MWRAGDAGAGNSNRKQRCTTADVYACACVAQRSDDRGGYRDCNAGAIPDRYGDHGGYSDNSAGIANCHSNPTAGNLDAATGDEYTASAGDGDTRTTTHGAGGA